ncbi:MAG TPA: FAD-dependent monooxygenase, partial [Wenzhouxiangella sp.]
SDEHGLPALGWIVEIPRLQHALWDVLKTHPLVTIKAPTQWHDWAPIDGGVRIRLKHEQGDLTDTHSARVLIAADGAQSRLRQSAGIETTQWDYNQQALIGPVTTQIKNPGTAWQRFTPLGPLALLPLPDGQSSIVWSIPNTEAQRLSELDVANLVEAINEVLATSHPQGDQTHNGSGPPITPMGAITHMDHAHWLPLKRIRANQLITDKDQGRLALVGDAGHSVHPLAGQGLNMGLADAAALVECLGPCLGSDQSNTTNWDQALARYNRWRLSASTLNATGIHWINEIARAPLDFGKHSLGLSFMLANRLWPARDVMIKKACGIDRDSPAVAQGGAGHPDTSPR